MTIHNTKIKIEKLDKIFQISDIHIRLFKRNDEYIDVFNALYEEINSKKNSNSIIIVTGDIVHGKTEMSPELVELTSDFFRNLGDIMPTIIIPGNHDANLNNSSRLDAISPIINALNHKNVFYLKKTGLYKVGDTVFSNMSVFDSTDKYIKANDIEFNGNKIGIYHGTIHNAVSDTGWKLTNEKVNTNFFDGYDIVLIGDIHKKQVLQRYTTLDGVKKPAIEYPGSLIQQNHAESLNNHGMLIWSVDSKTNEFIEIPNKYGFVTFDIKKGILETKLDYVPEKPRFRLRFSDTPHSEIKKYIVDLRDKYNPVEVTINRTGLSDKIQDDSKKIDISNIRNVDFQNTLLEDYIRRNNNNITDDIISKVYQINEHLNSMLPVEDITRNIIWKPKVFKFSNMFSYGESNSIDFSKMNGIVGLFASNASGKTSVLESLMFCLFGKCSKAYKPAHIINNRCDKFWCTLSLDIAGEEFIIKRVGKKSKDGNVKVVVDFLKILADGTEISLNGEQRRDTDSIIKSYIGTYDDFMLTAVRAQSNTGNFVDKSQSERKDLLTSFMDINIFEELYELGTIEVKEYQSLLKEYKRNDYEADLLTVIKDIEKNNAEYSNFKLLKDELVFNKSIVDDQILELTKNIVKIEKMSMTIESMNLKKSQKEKLINENLLLLNEIDSAISLLNEKQVSVQSKIKEFESNNIEEKNSELLKLENELSTLTSTIDKFKITIKQKMEKTENLRKLEYDVNCKFCMNNIFVKDAIAAKEELEKDKKTAEIYFNRKKELTSKIELLFDIKAQYELYSKVKQLYKDIELKILKEQSRKSSLHNTIESDKASLANIINDIEKYYKLENDIKNNEKIENEILILKLDVSKYNGAIKNAEDDLRESHSRLLYSENKKVEIENSISKFKEMEDKFESYQYYLNAIHRDSIPYELISKIVPEIETEANNILAQMVEFAILLDLDGKNVNVKLIYDENKFWPLEMASGMEQFITSLVLRVALTNITSLPRPNFLAVDEGFGTLDSDNSSNLPMMLDYLKTQFDFLFIISHMDNIKDFVDIPIDLKKDSDGFSKITYK